MPYFKRAGQLYNTLISFAHHYADRDDFEVVLVEDVKNKEDQVDHGALLDVVGSFERTIPIRIIDGVPTLNPAPMYNIAARAALGNYLVITNPECFHITDILKGFDSEFNCDEGCYVVCACQKAVKNNLYISKFQELEWEPGLWAQHSEYRNGRYHYCTALGARKYQEIGGFDEIFKDGIACDDDDFRDTVIHAGIPIIVRDDLLVLHQYHPEFTQAAGSKRTAEELVAHNRELYYRKKRARLPV